jgi:hypothetical protein
MHSLASENERRVKEEDICWAFARELLMPSDFVVGLAAADKAERLMLAQHVASECQVSLVFALRHLLYTSPAFSDCMAIVAMASAGAPPRVHRYWGVESRRALPQTARQYSDKIKQILLTEEVGSSASQSVFAGVADALLATGTTVECLERVGDWGSALVALFGVVDKKEHSPRAPRLDIGEPAGAAAQG